MISNRSFFNFCSSFFFTFYVLPRRQHQQLRCRWATVQVKAVRWVSRSWAPSPLSSLCRLQQSVGKAFLETRVHRGASTATQSSQTASSMGGTVPPHCCFYSPINTGLVLFNMAGLSSHAQSMLPSLHAVLTVDDLNACCYLLVNRLPLAEWEHGGALIPDQTNSAKINDCVNISPMP